MKYSIITINYNNRDGLEKTILSVINQTCQDFEYIIIDGGSTDGSVDIIKKYNDRINYWVSEPDKGIYNAMNKGILQAHGEYLNFMNSGDCFFDNEVLNKVNNNETVADMIVGKDYHENEITGESFSSLLPINPSSLYFYIATFPHQSTFFKYKLFSNCLYDESLKIVSDLKFYIQQIVINGCSIQYYPDIVCRREKDGISDSESKIKYEEWNKLLEEFYPIGIRKDYDRLCLLKKDVFDKLLYLCEKPKALILIRYSIKIVYRIFNFLKK